MIGRRPAKPAGPAYPGQPPIIVKYRFDPDGPWYSETTWTPQAAVRAASKYRKAGAVEIKIDKSGGLPHVGAQ